MTYLTEQDRRDWAENQLRTPQEQGETDMKFLGWVLAGTALFVLILYGVFG